MSMDTQEDVVYEDLWGNKGDGMETWEDSEESPPIKKIKKFFCFS